jgi:predicted porin
MEDYGTGTHSGTAYGRDSGQVQYTTPSFGGFQPFVIQKNGKSNLYFTGASANGFTKGVQTLGANSTFAGFNYANGPIKSQFTTGSGFNKEKYNIINVQYTIGGVDIALNQMNQKNDQYNYAQSIITSYAHATTEIGLRTDVTPNLSLSISTLVNNKAVTTHADTKKAVSGMRAKYSFSKRTFLEGFYGSVAQDFNATSGSSATSGANGSAYYLGLAHSF